MKTDLSIIILLLLCAPSGSLQAQPLKPIRFSLKTEILDLTNSLASPGNVRIPLSPTNTNIEIVDWATPPAKTNHTSEFLIKLNQPTLIGTIIVYDAGTISRQAEGGWKPLSAGQETQHRLQFIPLPAGELVEAIKVSVPAKPMERSPGQEPRYRAILPFLTMIPVRALNVAGQAKVSVSTASDPGPPDKPWLNKPETLVDGFVDALENFSTPERSEDISEDSPEWVRLTWVKPVTIRGLAMFRGSTEQGFGRAHTEVYTGAGDPSATTGSEGWAVVQGRASAPGRFRSHEIFVSMKPLETRAVRIRSIGGIRRIAVGEIAVLTELEPDPAP